MDGDEDKLIKYSKGQNRVNKSTIQMKGEREERNKYNLLGLLDCEFSASELKQPRNGNEYV